jgi:hypothetical protein
MVKATSTSVDSMPSQPIPATSLRNRPRDYFRRHDLQTTLLTQVKGRVCRVPLLTTSEQIHDQDNHKQALATLLVHVKTFGM